MFEVKLIVVLPDGNPFSSTKLSKLAPSISTKFPSPYISTIKLLSKAS